MTKINYSEFKNLKQAKDRHVYLNDKISSMPPCSPVMISDALARKYEEGGWVLRAIGNQSDELLKSGQYEKLPRWKIEVICDEWGNTLGEGDIVKRRTPKVVKNAAGQLATANDHNIAIINGTYEDTFFETRNFVIDKKGCIECNFEAATSLLNLKGVHYLSGHSLAGEIRESIEPMTAPNGQQLVKQNWLYREVSNEAYENLKDKPKRVRPLNGIDSIDKIKAYEEKDKKKRKEGGKAKTVSP